MATNNQSFHQGNKQVLSDEDKLALGELVKKYKKEYDAEVKSMEGKTVWDNKRKKHVPV